MRGQTYDAEVDALRRADASEWNEIILRSMIVVICAVALWLATGRSYMLLWGACYIAFNSGYMAYLHRVSGPITFQKYITVCLLNIFVTLWYSGMALLVLTFDDPVLKIVGVLGLIGLALHNLSRHSDLSHIAIWDMCLVTGCIAFAALILANETGSGSGQAAAIIASICVGMYYIFSSVSAIRTRQKLKQSRETEIHTQKMRAVGQLTSGVAHDFNNILTVIRGNLELMGEVVDFDERETLRQAGLNATERAASLVAQMLAYARKAPLQLARVNLSNTIHSALSLSRRALPDKIQVDLVEPLPAVSLLLDQQLFDSAILNALINARDAMLPQGGQVKVSAFLGDHGSTVAIRIQDTGPGMPERDLLQATDPFFTTKGVGEGSGLGLSMIQGFAEQHGGTLALKNANEGGLQLVIRLPVEQVVLEARPSDQVLTAS